MNNKVKSKIRRKFEYRLESLLAFFLIPGFMIFAYITSAVRIRDIPVASCKVGYYAAKEIIFATDYDLEERILKEIEINASKRYKKGSMPNSHQII